MNLTAILALSNIPATPFSNLASAPSKEDEVTNEAKKGFVKPFRKLQVYKS
jgi:hypothetical protein